MVAIKTDQFRFVLASYRRAISLDPNFAEAHAGYARTMFEIWQRGVSGIVPGNDARIMAYEAVGRALELDPYQCPRPCCPVAHSGPGRGS